MKDETISLLQERAANKGRINDLRDKNQELTRKLCEIEGACPHCKNWHYPHCGADDFLKR